MDYSRRIRAPLYQDGRRVTFRVDLSMDLASIVEVLGRKAIGNRSKRARAMGGLIVAMARDPQVEP